MSRELTTERTDDAPDFNAGWLKRLQQLTLIGFVAAILVFVVLFVIFFYQLSVVREKVQTAKDELSNKQAQLVELDKQLANKNAQLETAKTTARELREDVQLSRTDGGPVSLPAYTEDIGVMNSNMNMIANANTGTSTANTSTATNTNAALRPPPPARIYIQIADDAAQMQGASNASAKLREKGYVVPDIETVGRARSPNDSQLRFYRTDDPAQSAQAQRDADDIINVVRQTGVELKKVSLPPSRNVRPRHYEIWFGNNASPR